MKLSTIAAIVLFSFTALETTVSGANVRRHHITAFGTVIMQNNAQINKDIAKIRSEDKFDNPTFSIGGEYLYQARKIRMGLGFNYNFGDKVDTTLKRIDDGRIISGDIKLNSYEIYLMFEKNFIYKRYLFPFGWFLAPKFKNLIRVQNANDMTIKDTRAQWGFSLGLFYQHNIFKFMNIKLRGGYDLLGIDGSGPILSVGLDIIL